MIDRLNRRLFRALIDHWIMILLVAGITWIFFHGMQSAGWVRGDTLIARSVLRGMAFGWLLSISSFRGRWAAAYSLAISVLLTGASMAGLFPTIWQGLLAQAPLPELLISLNLRLWTLLYRIGAWFAAITANSSVGDTGLFVYLMSLVVWNAITWFLWGCLRTYRPYPGVILLGVLLAANARLSGQGIWQSWFYLTLAILLLIRTEYRRNHIEWDRRGLDYPDDGGYDWGGTALVLTMLITTAALMGSLVGTREGLRVLSEMVTDTREKTAETAEKLFTGVTPPRVEKPVLLARMPDLQHFGSSLPQGKDVIMWVTTSDPPPPPPEATYAERPRQRYWRSKIYTHYTPTGWDLLPLPEEEFIQPGDTPPADRVALQQRFEINAQTDRWLFASNQPVVSGPGSQLRQDADSDTVILTGSANQYQVTSWVPALDADALINASSSYSQAIREQYLQLPPTLPARVRGLSGQVSAGAASPYEKALRIQNFLRSTYRYDLAVPSFEPGNDFVDTFLFEEQAGFCTHFASAMVVMLRLEGVPSRVVAGYSMGGYDYNRQAYRVTADSAHAWVEVYFPGLGWVEFEPTPSQAAIQYDPRVTESAQAPPVAEDLSGAASEGLDLPARAVVAAAFLLAAAGLAWQSYWLARPISGGAAGRLYWSVRESLRLAGIPSSPATTPDEFLLRCSAVLTRDPALRQVTQDVTMLYQRAMFSHSLPSAGEVRSTRRSWQQVRARMIIFVVKQWLRRLNTKFVSRSG